MPVDRAAILAGRAAALARRARAAARLRYRYGRPFSPAARLRLLILSIDERIPQSQIHPFHFYARQLRDRYGAEIREVPAARYLTAPEPGDADIVCFQTHFDISQADLDALLDTIRRQNPNARLVYLDWFAPTDLRLAERLNGHVAAYVKKHLLADTTAYGRATLGDTNLTDHFAPHFGLDMARTVFAIPQGFMDKAVLGPSFVTADFMLGTFLRDAHPPTGDRPIDLHARIATEGTPWYRAMRRECAAAVGALDNINAVTGTGIGLIRYLHELRASKICFSPFGYGEVCWRDFEAVANGAVLLKPDMAHIRTDPDIFVAGETYMPVRWDLGDLDEKARLLLGDPGLRARLACNAFTVLHDYAASGRFTAQMAPLFAPSS
ncbi:MAG: glycosyltransferase [Jhaorihella sp.]